MVESSWGRKMKDKHGREIDYLRISLTENCNLRCIYCMADWKDDSVKICDGKQKDEISKGEVVDIVKIMAKFGIKKIRLTGGEPLLRKDIVEIVSEISEIDGISEVCLTTNGLQLLDKIEILKKAGLKRVNISLDTLDKEEYKRLTRGGDIEKVLNSIKKCRELSIPVKINAVITNIQGERSVQELANLTLEDEIDLRFIEIMPIGYGKGLKGYIGDEIINILSKKHEVENLYIFEGTSRYYKIKNSKGRIGVINPMSECFCGSCNRVRVTSKLELKSCLSTNDKLNLKELLNSNLEFEKKQELIFQAIYHRNEKNRFNTEESEENFMNQIGG